MKRISIRFKSAVSCLLAVVMLLACAPLGAGFTVASAAGVKQEIFNFITTEMGLNSAAACGILANIEKESDFNPNLYGDGGTSYGICQWHNTRFTALKNYCQKQGYSWTSLKGQLNYLKYELYNCKSDTGNVISHLNVPNTANGAYTAGYNWCYYFERPANKEAKSQSRGNLAKNTYWPVFKIEFNLGDVNSDGNVNSTDALLVIEFSVGKRTLNDTQKKAGDTNSDGKINSRDALIILQASTGKEDQY